MFTQNPRAQRRRYSSTLRAILNIDRARESRPWLKHWWGVLPNPTQLYNLPGLSGRLGIAKLFLKDESQRSPLGSFKVLGVSVALLRLILRRWPDGGYTPQGLLAGRHTAELRNFGVISATDGNHGRALAAAAQSIGCRCIIVLHKNVSPEREAAVAALGAHIVRIQGNYDESVAESARLAERNGWQVVSDTSYDDYEEIPRDVMQGYATIADEALEQSVSGSDAPPFTHVFLQGGVGGLAAGIVSYFHEYYGERRPIFIVVEPTQADCLYQSAIQGHATHALGSIDSLMAGLACGTASPLAWRFLESAVDFFFTLEDARIAPAMRTLAEGSEDDIPIVAGESGAAGLAALMQIAAEEPAIRREVGLDASSKVLVINTEGDTAPSIYTRLTGHCGKDVATARDAWAGQDHAPRI